MKDNDKGTLTQVPVIILVGRVFNSLKAIKFKLIHYRNHIMLYLYNTGYGISTILIMCVESMRLEYKSLSFEEDD